MRYRLLGNLEVERDDGVAVTIPAPKRRALLAFLLLQRGRAASRDQIIEALWGDETPDAARESLFAHVSRLRRDLGDGAIESVPGGYAMPLRADELDLIAFERDLLAGQRALAARQWFEASAALGAALARWRGPALADLAVEPFAEQAIRRLEESRAAAVEDRISADLELRRHHQLVPELEQLVRQHPLRERLWEQLMVALYRSGRQSDALDRYREVRRVLQVELGIDPSSELQELQRRILRHDPGLAVADATGGEADLPAHQSETVGRARELDEVVGAVSEHRLVTLTGPGGVGKTRLAVLAAAALVPEHPDGTQFIDLSMVRDADRVLERVGSAVGGGGRPQDAIGPRRMLLVLDNFEQVLSGAFAVSALLAACPSLRVLVTSRAPLRVSGEHQLEVPPLSRADAIELFAARAAAVSVRELPHDLLGEVVGRLDGLPLAVELAAARVKALTLEAMRDFLKDRMRFLTAGARDAPDRHRTLRDTIRWSYDLLAPDVRAAFRKLSVLAPGFDLDAAMEVGEADVDAVTELVDHSLLRRTNERYSMLETIRAFAEEVGEPRELDEALARHIGHFASLPLAARRYADDRVGEQGRSWSAIVAANDDNLRLAFERAVALGDGQATVQLFTGVSTYWMYQGITEEALRWASIALENARALTWQELEHVRYLAADLYRFSGDVDTAIDILETVLAEATSRDDLLRIGVSLDDLATSYAAKNDYPTAWRLLDQAYATHRRNPELNPRLLMHTQEAEIWVLLREGRTADAADKAGRHHALYESIPVSQVRGLEADLVLGCAAAAVGNEVAARGWLRNAIAAAGVVPFRGMLAEAMDALAIVEGAVDPARAAWLLGMSDRARAECRQIVFLQPSRDELIARLLQTLGAGAFESARAAGGAIPVMDMAGAALDDAAGRVG